MLIDYGFFKMKLHRIGADIFEYNKISVKLFEKLGKVYTEEEFDEFCFEFGIELDEVTSERQMKRKETQNATNNANGEEEGSDNVIYKLDQRKNDICCI